MFSLNLQHLSGFLIILSSLPVLKFSSCPAQASKCVYSLQKQTYKQCSPTPDPKLLPFFFIISNDFIVSSISFFTPGSAPQSREPVFWSLHHFSMPALPCSCIWHSCFHGSYILPLPRRKFPFSLFLPLCAFSNVNVMTSRG